MLSKNRIKILKSLHQTKYRRKLRQYLVEGHKSVMEWIADGRYVEACFATQEWLDKNPQIREKEDFEIVETNSQALSQISQFSTTPEVIVLANMPEENQAFQTEKLSLILDRIQDPGNLGTIIRTADWFGIKQIILMKGTVDLYNSKVIQSSMGSVLRMSYLDCDIEDLKKMVSLESLHLLIADMVGEDIKHFQKNNDQKYALVLGNEGQGVHEDYFEFPHEVIKIPAYGKAESLNVGIAAGIMMYELVI